MFRTRIALGIAAAALSLTALVAPAAPASASGLFKPDLQVKYKGETGVAGAHFYQFEVKNIGQDVAQYPYLSATVYRSAWNSILLDSSPVYQKLSPIPAGSSRTVTVPCNDVGGGNGTEVQKCLGVKAGVYDPNDIDDSKVSSRG
jgi:hypothetical protein